MRGDIGDVEAAHRLDQRIRAAATDSDADHAGVTVDMRLAFADLLDRSDSIGDPAAVWHYELEDVAAMHASDGIAAWRWWTLAELDTTAEVIWPAGLAGLIRDALGRR